LKQEDREKTDNKSDLSERIKKVLIECRMALPGAQAFLGFQFAIVFTPKFDGLPRSSQVIHFVSLLATTAAIVLLIAPAAFHRLVEGGQDTERFHRVASGLLIAALVFLAPGMAGDFLVVIREVTNSRTLAICISALLLLAFYLLWFGVSLWKHRTEGRAVPAVNR
jgi:threonine/homoserine/homoserine lactone efflux protein